MSSSSCTSRNQLQVTRVQRVKHCDCGVPAKERTLNKCSFFEWKDEEQEEGYYKNLLYSLKQKVDAKEDLSEMNNLRRRIVEVEFLLSQEQYKVAKSEKEVYDARKAISRYKMIVSLLFSCLVCNVRRSGLVNLEAIGYMSQGFRTYKERRNLSYNEEVMTRRSFTAKPARHREA
uniref:Uncharacterized protein n=1 Tax=Lactuca sativa TaxID=4236 RepID=A0A9R1UPH5_LACSA|nr:hypothetical protein LSAT_V11C800398950 [Lactuca sativa]